MPSEANGPVYGTTAVSLEDALHQCGILVRPTKGESMLPFLRQGLDFVQITPVGKRLEAYANQGAASMHLKPLETALFRRPNGDYVLHRIIKVKRGRYVFRGDNQTTFEKVPFDWVIGVATGFYIEGTFVSVDDPAYQAAVDIVCSPRMRKDWRTLHAWHSMQPEWIYLVELVRFALHPAPSAEAPLPPEGISWENLYGFAESQHLTAISFPAIGALQAQHGQPVPESVFGQWKSHAGNRERAGGPAASGHACRAASALHKRAAAGMDGAAASRKPNHADEDGYLRLIARSRERETVWESDLGSLLDLYLLRRSMEGEGIDWKYISARLEAGKLAEYERNMRRLAYELFSPDHSFEELRGSLFVPTMAVPLCRDGSLRPHPGEPGGELAEGRTAAYIAGRALPPLESMRARYPILDDLPFALPFCWVARAAHGFASPAKRRRIREEILVAARRSMDGPK